MAVATRPVVRTERLNFRLSREERELLDALAAERARTRTGVLCDLLLEARHPRVARDPDPESDTPGQAAGSAVKVTV